MGDPKPSAEAAPSLPGVTVKVAPPKPPKGAGQLAAEVGKRAAPAKREPGAAELAEGRSGKGVASLADDWAPMLVWALLAAAALGLLGFGAWWLWWREKPKKSPARPAPKAAPAPNLYADFKKFLRRLPRPLSRILDDLQPVIVLGNNASQKEQVALQLSGVLERKRIYPGLSHGLTNLSLYFGARSLVLVPSDLFLDSAGSSSDASWRRVLARVSRVRAPRVVVCLAHTPLDSGELDRSTLWAAKLRAHLDLIAAIRGENIELSVTVAQSSQFDGRAPLGATDALLEVLYAAGDVEGARRCISLAPFGGSSPLGSEERRQYGKDWVVENLRGYRQRWPRLLADPQRSATRVLQLSRFSECFQDWSASLGAGLAELLVPDGRQHRRPLGRELCFLPSREGHLVGTLGAFSGPSDEAGRRWRPKQSLLHRLIVASAAATLAVVMSLAYASDRSDWDEAATAALRYEPPETAGELDVVKRYVDGASTRPRFMLPELFERTGLRCTVVGAARKHLREMLDEAVDAFTAPEDVLQLVALYVAGNPDACAIKDGPNQAAHRELGVLIEQNIEEWRHVSELTDHEISSYLALACPQTQVQLEKLEREYGKGGAGERDWAPVPSVSVFGAGLQKLRGECQLTAEERAAIQLADRIADGVADTGTQHGAALAVLRVIRKLGTPTMGLLAQVFGRYEDRLQAIEDLRDEQADMQLLARDLRPFSELLGKSRAAATPGSLVDLNEQLRARLAGEVPAGEDAVIRLAVPGNTYVIDRHKVRASLLVRALGGLQQSFSDAIVARELAAETQELMFFSPEQFARMHVWTTRASMPDGIYVASDVPWRYTSAGFHTAVLGPVESMRQLLAAETCNDEADESTSVEYVARTTEFVSRRLSSYLVAYAEAWRDIYDSFSVSAQSELELSQALAALARPTSVHRGLLQEVLRQTQLVAPDGFPYSELLDAAQEPFATLPAALDEKAFASYQALLLEVANAGQAAPRDKDPAPAAPGAKGALPAEASLDAFMAELSGFGALTLAGLRDPELDVKARAHAWLDEVGLAPALRRPLLEPFDKAYARGHQNIAATLSRWWRVEAREIDAAILKRFPFSPSSTEEASALDLMSWLEPEEGRFAGEVLSIYRLVRRCGARPCVQLPEGMQETVTKLSEIQRALFDAKGEPRPFLFQLDPVPFASQSLLPKRAIVKLGDVRYEYFNTAPRRAAVPVPWNEAYVASLNVELVGARTVDEVAIPITTQKSVWAFLHLLRAATAVRGGRYRWELDATVDGARRGKVSVSYDVCQDVSRCNGLFERVLGWP